MKPKNSLPCSQITRHYSLSWPPWMHSIAMIAMDMLYITISTHAYLLDANLTQFLSRSLICSLFLSLYSLLGLLYWSFSRPMTASLLSYPLLFPKLRAMLVYLAGSMRTCEHLCCISLTLTVHHTVQNAEHCLQHPRRDFSVHFLAFEAPTD
jgi:hypothetical protein